MKTSIIEVHDMLAVLTVEEVEERMREVPGVESATVNFAAGNVAVRYDETRLDVADIKATVHQRGHQPADESVPEQEREHKPGQEPAAPTAGDHKGHEGHAAPVTASSPVAAEPKAPTDTLAAVPATATPVDPG